MLSPVRGALARPVGQSLDISVAAPPWLREGATPCGAADPELFFPYSYTQVCHEQIEEARALCHACPVRATCLEWAVGIPGLEGIWAATTPPERRRIRVRRA